MIKNNKEILGLIIFMMPYIARAQIMEKSYVTAEPLQYTKNGIFRGCGINLKFLEKSPSDKLKYATFSISFYAENFSAALLTTTFSTIFSAKTNPPIERNKIISFWIRLNNDNPITLIKNMPGEENSILGIANLDESLGKR